MKNFSGAYQDVISALVVRWKTKEGKFASCEYPEATRITFCEIPDDIIEAYVKKHPEERLGNEIGCWRV